MLKRMAPLTLLTVAGCASLGSTTTAIKQIATTSAVGEASPTTPAVARPLESPRGSTGPYRDLTEQEAMAEVAPMLGELAAADPELHAEVLEQLAGTKASLWSLTVQRAQHTLAYKQQLATKNGSPAAKLAVKQPTPPTTPASADPTPPSQPRALPPAASDDGRVVQASASIETEKPVTPQPAVTMNPAMNHATPQAVNPQTAPAVIQNQHFTTQPNTAPAATAVAMTPPPSSYQLASSQAALSQSISQMAAPGAPANGSQGMGMGSMGSSSSAPADWRAHLDAAISQLDSSNGSPPQSSEEARERIRLRLLELVAGNTDRAVASAPGLSTAEQGYWSNQLYALSTLLEEEHSSDRNARIDAAARHQAEASAKLRSMGSLRIRNFVTCHEVYGFGAYDPLPNARYAPGDQVVLYAEIDNYQSDATAEGYHTTLASTYRLTDPQGREVAAGDFPEVDDLCLTLRRDFHIQYGVTVPETAPPGDYRLELSVHDRLGDKIGHDELTIAVGNP